MTTNDTASTTSAAPTEPSMDEYARMRIAGESVKKSDPETPAAAVEKAPVVAATEGDTDPADAAATDEGQVDGKTTTASATEENPEAQIEEAHPVKKGIQKRFSEMTAKQKELQAQADEAKAASEAANRRADEAMAETARLRAEADKAQAAVPSVVAEADDPTPNRNDYDDPDEYTVAISAHATRQELRKSTKAAHDAAQERAEAAKKESDEARQAQVQAAIAELHGNFQKRVAEVKPEYPDYAEKVENNTELILKNEVFFTIEKAVDSPHILYHLATNPKEAEALNKMHPQEVAMRIGEMQAELRIARKPKVSKAATPIKPVGNRASPQPKTPNEESTDEYAVRRNKEIQAAQKNRSRILS